MKFYELFQDELIEEETHTAWVTFYLEKGCIKAKGDWVNVVSMFRSHGGDNPEDVRSVAELLVMFENWGLTEVQMIGAVGNNLDGFQGVQIEIRPENSKRMIRLLFVENTDNWEQPK